MATNQHVQTATIQIGEVAKRSSLTIDAIRFYEKRKLLPKAVRLRKRSLTASGCEPALGGYAPWSW